ncbi:MAG TPA: hypothetical protein VJI75_03365 [Candidatus Nanoarchaeia archaeon]|nr:hypothetical protein [Candidatus Nanoarchaeia archaeon]
MDEKDIPELQGMEKHHGYKEYKKLVHEGDLKPGDEVITLHKYPSGKYGFNRNAIID